MPSDKIEQSLVDELLALPTQEQQKSLLRTANSLNADGLGRLLDVADELLKSDPSKTRRLANLCVEVADEAAAPVAVPRASYVLAGVHSVNGEFEEDLRLSKTAYDGYVALGMSLEALRTNVGRMDALLEIGRYEEALDAGQVILNALDGKGEFKISPTQAQSDMLTALVQQNRGRCLEYMGQYDEALSAYAVAEERYRTLGMNERLGEISDNRGTVLSALGRGREALSAHEAAAAVFSESGLTLSHAMSLSNIGMSRLRLGDYMGSLSAFEQARHLLGFFDARAEEYFLLRNTADTYLALNLYSEALASYQELYNLLEGTGMEYDRAQTLWGMGSVLIARSEFEKAEEVLAEAARLLAAADNAPLLSGVMLEQAALLEAQGRHEVALTTTHRALNLLSKGNWPVHQIYSHLRIADLLLDSTEAESNLLEARRLADPLGLPQLSYRLDERLGRLRLLQGREKEAKALLEAAVEQIERLRGTVAQESMRASFLRDKTAAYEGLLRLHLTQGGEDARQAFAVAERARSRALVDLLAGVAEKGTMASAGTKLEKRIGDLSADLNATYSQMLGDTSNGQGAALQDLHERAAGLEAEIGRLHLQATAASSDPFAASATVPEDVLEQLPPDQTLLAYHAVGEEVLAFVVEGNDIRVVRHLCTVASARRLSLKLGVQWDRFRAGREFAGRHAAMLERSARQVLVALYDELLAPLEPLLEEAVRPAGENDRVPRLVVVPHGLLHQVPFHALFDGEKYLLERFEVSYAPSATVYALCQERDVSDRAGAAVFGVEDPSIPAAAAEARAVAERLTGAEVRIGQDATIEALRSGAPKHGVLHLACHGLFRSDNPMFSALKLHDGWLMAAGAMSLDIPGALVTLSACESGRSEVIAGDEILGLTRAFLGAGAATLVVSLWLAQDETTAELMGNWYERLRGGMGRAAALRAAQLEIKERHPHPYYWAPFVLIGKR